VLGGEPHIITGVVSSQFDFQDFGPAPEVWVPFQLDRTREIRATILKQRVVSKTA
jgi:hypothetical protein